LEVLLAGILLVVWILLAVYFVRDNLHMPITFFDKLAYTRGLLGDGNYKYCLPFSPLIAQAAY
jgi:hypothetical protein